MFLWRGGLPPNNANSTLELKSMGLELKAIKPNYWISCIRLHLMSVCCVLMDFKSDPIN